MKAHILATCRMPELMPMTLLVFKTLRIGFPSAEIHVHLNRMESLPVEADFFHSDNTIHHLWIEKLIASSDEPFWIVDTDVVFFGEVESWRFNAPLAGRRIPEWNDEFSGCITRARLHPSLMYLDPEKIRASIAVYESKIASTPFTPRINLIHPICLPFKGKSYFHDTASLLYHAIGGHRFSEVQLDAYGHFNFGTIPDVVLPRLTFGKEMAKVRQAAIDNPELLRGAWRAQEKYYAERQ